MMKRLFPYFKGYKKQAILAPALIALETICELILPLLMAEIIDSGIQKGNMPVILKMGALMLVVAAAAMYCGVMSAKHAAFAAQGLGANLRKAQFEKISTFSFRNIDRFSGHPSDQRRDQRAEHGGHGSASAHPQRRDDRSLYGGGHLYSLAAGYDPHHCRACHCPGHWPADEGLHGAVPCHAASAGSAQ
mgnify:CR=1 FL=1